MRLASIPRGLGLDTVQVLTPHSKTMRRQNYHTAFRYINRTRLARDVPDPSDDWLKTLSRKERDDLLPDGWTLSPVQIGIGRSPGSTEKHGEDAGDAAAWNAKQLGFVEGSVVWCDCEWSKSVLPGLPECLAYMAGWSRVVSGQGFVAGLYVDFHMNPTNGFTSAVLFYAMEFFSAYWRSASYCAAVDVRGAAVQQSTECALVGDVIRPYADGARCDLRFDIDMVCIDGLGTRVKGLAA